jgi:hypothetical protein
MIKAGRTRTAAAAATPSLRIGGRGRPVPVQAFQPTRKRILHPDNTA